MITIEATPDSSDLTAARAARIDPAPTVVGTTAVAAIIPIAGRNDWRQSAHRILRTTRAAWGIREQPLERRRPSGH